MSFIGRPVEQQILDNLRPNRVVLLVGPRRVGKTEMLKSIAKKLHERYLFLNGEDQQTIDLFAVRSKVNFQRLMGRNKILILDEAQAIPDIGAKLKLMVDTLDGIRIIASGSSVFDLNNQMGEPLVGRKTTFYLFPLAQTEFSATEDLPETLSKLDERLIYGSYPELEHLSSYDKKRAYLNELVSSYLLKDILAFEGIRKREKIISLLRMIAFRVGSEISVEGIANELQMSKNTVDRYLDILCKTLILHKLTGYSRNLDNEITKKNKYYFIDNGIRNSLIQNFNSLALRDDIGKLWENYLVSERLKKQSYDSMYAANFFWRTHAGQEIDWVEELNGKLDAYEFKWLSETKFKVPKRWTDAYPQSEFNLITKSNYLDFIS